MEHYHDNLMVSMFFDGDHDMSDMSECVKNHLYLMNRKHEKARFVFVLS